jgi:hypothetical protein
VDVRRGFVGASELDPIRVVFTNYLRDSEALISKQLTVFLTPWTTLLDGINWELEDRTGACATLRKKPGLCAMISIRSVEKSYKEVGPCAEETVAKSYVEGSISLSPTSIFDGRKTDGGS